MPKEQIKDIFVIVNKAKKPSILMSGYVSPYDKINLDGFRKIINELEEQDVKDVDLLINSGGGSTIEGLAIGDLMEQSSINFHGIVVGTAASMAGGILMFCKQRAMYKNARIMTHKVQAGAYGESDALRSMADLADQEEEKIINQFIDATGKAEATVKTWFKSGVNKWFNAKESLENNLVQTIIEPKKSTKNIDNSITNELEVVNAFQPLVEAMIEPQEPKNNLETINMNTTQIIALFAVAGLENSLTANSTQPEIDAELKKVFNDAALANKYKQELDDHKKTQAENLINQAVADGKLKATEKDAWTKNAIENYDVVATSIARMGGKPEINNGLKPDVAPVDGDQHELMKGREAWNFEKWQDEAPEDLERLEAEAPEAFEALFNKHFKN